MNVDEQVYNREIARLNRDWKESDRIRDILEEYNVFVNDTAEGQEVFHLPYESTRKEFDLAQARDRAAEANFDAWLTTVKAKTYQNI